MNNYYFVGAETFLSKIGDKKSAVGLRLSRLRTLLCVPAVRFRGDLTLICLHREKKYFLIPLYIVVFFLIPLPPHAIGYNVEIICNK